MKNTLSTLVVFFVLVIVCLMYSNNKFVNLEEDVLLQQAQVETTLQRRNDLIPNLVETVKGYMEHEEAVFTKIAEARSALVSSIDANDMDGINESQKQLDQAIDSLFMIVSEDYPELKADEEFIRLQDELAGTENRIYVARQYLNEAISKYNKAVKNFPGSLIAGIFGHKPLPLFEAEDEAKDAPVVSFD